MLLVWIRAIWCELPWSVCRFLKRGSLGRCWGSPGAGLWFPPFLNEQQVAAVQGMPFSCLALGPGFVWVSEHRCFYVNTPDRILPQTPHWLMWALLGQHLHTAPCCEPQGQRCSLQWAGVSCLASLGLNICKWQQRELEIHKRSIPSSWWDGQNRA